MNTYYIVLSNSEDKCKIYRITNVTNEQDAIQKFINKYLPLISELNLSKEDLIDTLEGLNFIFYITTNLYE